MELSEGRVSKAAPQEATVCVAPVKCLRWLKTTDGTISSEVHYSNYCESVEERCADCLGENGQQTILKCSMDCKHHEAF